VHTYFDIYLIQMNTLIHTHTHTHTHTHQSLYQYFEQNTVCLNYK